MLAAGVTPVTEIKGSRQVPDAKYFVGTGKAQEIADAVKALNAEIVLINHSLSPAQERNLEKLVQCRVFDRTGVILDIFAQRAQTHEGKLQVELAQLQHLSTRLVRGWTHLERQKGGLGLRGPGETQLETDRRLLRNRIKAINKSLLKVRQRRQLSRRSRQRKPISSVSLVGYTNAGKSTLFNSLTDSDAFVADQLFATLDPTLRRVNLPEIGDVVLADTVGFIRHLPHDLVDAFRATLEETRNADLLLHVIDASDLERQAKIEEVDNVLEEINADEVPCLHVYNKIDQLDDAVPRVDRDMDDKPVRVWVSAVTGAGLDLLRQAITDLLSVETLICEVSLAPEQGKLRAMLYELDCVMAESHDEHGGWAMELRIQRRDYDRLFHSK